MENVSIESVSALEMEDIQDVKKLALRNVKKKNNVQKYVTFT